LAALSTQLQKARGVIMRSLKELGNLVHDAELELPEKVEDLVDENLVTLCGEATTRI